MKTFNPTITVFIPAHNEEQNIGNLLLSIMRQDVDNFDISAIVVLCDGCTDDTARISREYELKYPKIKIIDDGKRLGKHRRLIDAFSQCRSDIAVVIDGDLLLSDPSTLSEMILPFKDQSVSLVGGNNIPVKGNGIQNYLINVWTEFWLDIKMHIRKGNNIHNVRSCCLALRMTLVHDLEWPAQLQSHGQFLFLECLRNGRSFIFRRNAVLWYRNPDTFSDYAIQKKRGVGSSRVFTQRFGQSAIDAYRITAIEKMSSFIFVFLHHPVNTIIAIVCKIYISFYLKNKPDSSEHHFWKTAESTKKSISMDYFSRKASYPMISTRLHHVFRLPLITTLFALMLIIPSIRGAIGNPIRYQYDHDTSVGSPYELSNSTARFALTKSIVEDRSLFLSRDLAHFASPDVVDYKDKFISIFTPGISFAGIPFYLIGRFFGVPQLGAYMLNIAFALICIYLIASVAKKLGASDYASYTGGLIFIFASNAFVYTQSYSQHIASSALLMGSIYLAFSEINIFHMALIGFLAGCAILVDIPNVFLLAPVILYAALRDILITRTTSDIELRLRFRFVAMIVGLLPVLGLFAWYNYATTGSYTKLAQSIGRSHVFRDAQIQNPTDLGYDLVSTPENNKFIQLPFDSRHLIRGGSVLLFSDERSWLWYSPIILLGIFGLLQLFRNTLYVSRATVLFSIIGLNILLYSMFGDPWGGWAFGPRYLIPAAAILATCISVAITRFRNNWLFHVIFIVMLFYSICISVLGALTTSAIPPKVEAVNLAKRIPHTYKLNLQMAESGTLSSLAFDALLKQKVSAKNFWIGYSIMIIIFVLTYYMLAIRSGEKRMKQI